MSRFDYIKIHASHFVGLAITEDELSQLDGLEFQTKDLEREFLDYVVDEDGILSYEDFMYELKDADNGLFNKVLCRIPLGKVITNHTGVVMFYGKPYESMYTLQAKFTNGRLKYVRLLSIV